MSRNILDSAKEYLANASRVRIAHLIILELPGSTEDSPVYDYLTDYSTEVSWDGKLYAPDRVTGVGDVRQSTGLTNYKVTVDVAGEYQSEVDRALSSSKDTSFVGKSLRILRAYLDEYGQVIPFDKTTKGPMEYFFGNLTDIAISDGVVSGSSKVSWSCAGKFEDFNAVQGRITDDATHRGLETSVNTNEVIPGTGAKKPEYRTDTGFQHANQTINLISSYSTTETRYKMKSSFFGLKSKLKEYEVSVTKPIELGVDLAAAYIPFVRGVRRVPGIPVFLDNIASDSAKLVIVYAICEGPATLLDLYINGEGAICSTAELQTTEMCLGDQRQGDTLSKYMIASGGYSQLHDTYSPKPVLNVVDEEGEIPVNQGMGPILPETEYMLPTEGLSEVTEFTITNSTGVKKFTFHPGSPNQAADSRLVALAAAQDFIVQNSQGAGPEYWDENAKLLDTAYVVLEMEVTEEEQGIPELEFVVECFGEAGDGTKIRTLNMADHLLDYLSNDVYGGGISPADIDYASFDYVRAYYNRELESYDPSWVDYWRYLGWDSKEDHIPKLLECNTLIKTEETTTKNVESMLAQMDATLNQLGGKYHLSIEDGSDPIADIHMDECIGAISVKDKSTENKWNSISASLIDPALSWSANKLVFFDSTYLEQDKGVQKKGNITFSNITNYYVGRNWAKRQLDRSRFSREITITTYYKYTYLYPNANVTFTYDRFGWDKKKLRVSSMTLKNDGLVSLTLRDTDDSIYEDIEDNESTVPPISGTGVPAPNNFRIISPGDPEFSFPEGIDNIYGYLIWDEWASSTLLRYELENWRTPGDYTQNIIVPYNRKVQSKYTDKYHIFYPLDDLVVGQEYLFKVRTLDLYGNQSKYSILSYLVTDDDRPISYSNVTGFTMLSPDEDGNYLGPSTTYVWDRHVSNEVETYAISFMDPTGPQEYGTILVHAKTQAECILIFDLSKNMDMYSNLNGGGVGAFRDYRIRIRAIAGNASSAWVYLQESVTLEEE